LAHFFFSFPAIPDLLPLAFPPSTPPFVHPNCARFLFVPLSPPLTLYLLYLLCVRACSFCFPPYKHPSAPSHLRFSPTDLYLRLFPTTASQLIYRRTLAFVGKVLVPSLLRGGLLTLWPLFPGRDPLNPPGCATLFLPNPSLSAAHGIFPRRNVCTSPLRAPTPPFSFVTTYTLLISVPCDLLLFPVQGTPPPPTYALYFPTCGP